MCVCVCVCARARARVYGCAGRVGEAGQMGGVQAPGVRLKFGGCSVSQWHFYYVFGLPHVCCMSGGFLCVSSMCFLETVWWLCSLTVWIAHLFLFSDALTRQGPGPRQLRAQILRGEQGAGADTHRGLQRRPCIPERKWGRGRRELGEWGGGRASADFHCPAGSPTPPLSVLLLADRALNLP